MDRLTPTQVNDLLLTGAKAGAVYLVGIGGCGMSGLAHLLLDSGLAVYGSDLSGNESIRELSQRGATIHIGHAAEHLIAARPLLVAYSSAIPSNNPELLAAQSLRIPIVRRAVLLAALLHRQRGICVAGMHGKTTTTALVAFALERLGAHPSYAIGGHVPQLDRHGRFTHPVSAGSTPMGPGPLVEDNWFVIEADESDGTLRSFQPQHAVILNVDEEHLDFYANLEAVCHEFADFAAQTRELVVYCADDPRLVDVLGKRRGAVSFGYHPQSQYRIARSASTAVDEPMAPVRSGSSAFDVWVGSERLGHFALSLIGEKNVSNATAVIALLHKLGYAPADIARAIEPFQGASRRQHQLFANGQFRIFDDYGHHPREITATLRALKDLGSQRLLVAFQPHRFTRTYHLMSQFATCFQAADKLWLTEIYPASETPIAGVNGAALAAAVRASGQSVEFVSSLGELKDAVRAAMHPGDVVLFLGAGDITQAAHGLADELLHRPSISVATHFDQLASQVSSGAVIKRSESLAKKTTFRVGGQADIYLEPASEADLQAAVRYCTRASLPFFILGRGSNLLVRDGGVRGVVICLGQPAFCQIESQGQSLICGAGARLKAVVVEAREHGITGLEFMEGIPGTVGGALRMNAGAMGASIFQVVERVRYLSLDGQIGECAAGEIPTEYRHCRFFDHHIALGATLQGQAASREEIDARLKTFSARRWRTQPAAPSAGCVFKNAPEMPAGKLIEELGLKGTRVGGAIVSEVHGNFIVNEGNATAEDILHLIRMVQARAQSQRGINLETEIQIVGEGVYE